MVNIINFENLANFLLGLDKDKLLLFHMIARAIFVYFLGILLLLINRRFINGSTTFDIILRLTVATSFASAITGNSPFFPTIGMVIFLVLFNYLLAALSYYNPTIEKLLKGTSQPLILDNKIQWRYMRRNFITKQDLLINARERAGVKEISDIKQAIFEANGKISAIPKKDSSQNRQEL